MRFYRIYGTGSATSPGAASVTMARAGRIKSVEWASEVDCTADNVTLYQELSLQVTSVFQQNDSRGPVSIIAYRTNSATPSVGAINGQRFTDIPVAQGERLFLNATQTGVGQWWTNVIIGVEDA